MAGEALPHRTQQKNAVMKVTGNQDQMVPSCLDIFNSIAQMFVLSFLMGELPYAQRSVEFLPIIFLKHCMEEL